MAKKLTLNNKSLLMLRNEIDQLDHELITLLSQRMKVVVQVGLWKREHGVIPLDKDRWQKVVDSRRKIAKKNNIDPDFIEEILNLIHQHALEIERKK